MAKITKKQYENKIAYLKWLQELNRCKIEAYRMALEENPGQCQNKDYLYDRKYVLEKLIDRLDHKWETRNWTAADWNSYSLAVNNID